jgi:hypothetical protein
LQFSNPLNIGAVVNVALEPDDPVEGIVNVTFRWMMEKFRKEHLIKPLLPFGAYPI